MSNWKPLFEAVVNGDAPLACMLAQQALAAGAAPLTLVDEAMMLAMAEVGRRFEEEEYFVPELLRSAHFGRCIPIGPTISLREPSSLPGSSTSLACRWEPSLPASRPSPSSAP